jgi:hypothetical protein
MQTVFPYCVRFSRAVAVHAVNVLSNCAVVFALALFVSVLLFGQLGGQHRFSSEQAVSHFLEMRNVAASQRLTDEGVTLNQADEINWSPLLETASTPASDLEFDLEIGER